MMVRFFFFIIISDSSNRIRCQMIPPRIMHLTVVQGIDFVISGINYTFLVFVNWLIELYRTYMSDPLWLPRSPLNFIVR